MPDINITKLVGGEQRLSIAVKRTDDSILTTAVKVDSKGNALTTITIEQPDGSKKTSVVAKDDQEIPVASESGRVVISEDGILVDAAERSPKDAPSLVLPTNENVDG